MKFQKSLVRTNIRSIVWFIKLACCFVANFSKKPFDIIDFGICYLDDLIGELKDNKEVVIDQEFGIIKLYRKGLFSSFL